jgi:DNA-binding protein HU-beta
VQGVADSGGAPAGGTRVAGIRRRSVNKQELIAKIVKDTGLTKVGAMGAVESLLDGITRSLKKGHAVTFVGFGSFQTSMRKARTARNPQTGASVKVPKRRVVRFKAGKGLKDSVN